ncbi:succinylglutamate desuccinylase [Ketobacter sp. MCCC 1A13808]|uniref:succinylglutamate desuccinylase/aspartoacylase family protein n=1 Tax=Ketobacter sp. MCCC 1A13808 TaxID=2602738 RepID=UPI000F101C3C|nr:succinylglutamate desuccinylase/aspartoacylase family protein [Ketobacter sp. MCCC 1A13808]MVF11372.1 succinylglutamate desuccinylase [Ketobacter sp. MCCC 1A13808]RLP54685.1 MAG: succinylglutamate desuccinylase [Ketobacter sp.]
MSRSKNSLEIFGERIEAGTQKTFHIPIGQLYTQTNISIPVQVVNGKAPGPVLLICAAIHGDELNGVEVTRRVISAPWIKSLKGTLIAVPMVNVLGVIHRSRYLPDRRDLNRCFPGSEEGSLGGRIAHLFVQEILGKCQYAIDLHTGAIHRSNMPQIRVHLENTKAADMAHAFGLPLIIDAPIRDGSLRGAGDDLGIPIITYEAGEALRFDEPAIIAGVKGVRNVMTHLNMLPPRRNPKKETNNTFVAKSSAWVRAPADGLFRSHLKLGDRVVRGELLGIIDGPLGGSETPVKAPFGGIVIGATNLPLVNLGEALLHVGRFDDIEDVETVVDEFRQEVDMMPVELS